LKGTRTCSCETICSAATRTNISESSKTRVKLASGGGGSLAYSPRAASLAP
jgi:hypothetical protein